MELGIRPATPAGARYVELCEQHAADTLRLGADLDL